MTERLAFPLLEVSDGTLEQLAQRRAADAISYEVNRLEDDARVQGWERLNRSKAFELAQRLRDIACELYAKGVRGLEMKAAFEQARRLGFPCVKCRHKHEGVEFQRVCFHCECQERPERV